MAEFYIKAIVPLALRGVFTYSVPEELIEEMVPGKRVVLPFGPKRYYAALIYRVDVQLQQGQKPKSIEYVLDNEPIVNGAQLQLWEWMSNHYMSGLGSIMLAALPGAFRLSSQSTVVSTDKELDAGLLSEMDFSILAELEGHENQSVQEIEKRFPKKRVQRALDRLIKLGAVEIQETIEEPRKPRTVRYVEFVEGMNEAQLERILELLVKAPKQLEVVMRFIELADYFGERRQKVEYKRLLHVSGASSAIYNQLERKQIFRSVEVLDQFESSEIATNNELNASQSAAVESILNHWETKPCVLLHGITGSGKTNIYAHLIKHSTKKGQKLILVPEIALTTQHQRRLERLLGTEIMVYHSRFTNKQRLTMWMQMLSDNPPKIILGARSSLFLPFTSLDTIILDEEHESSYKQQESSPHYNARDCAVWMGYKHGAKVLLGSATPNVTTYFMAKSGKYGHVELNERFGEVKLPKIETVDLKIAHREKTMKADFTPEAIGKIKATVASGKQVIIFQNRRGYAPFQLCESCGWSAECVNCDVNLTYHKFFDKLLCHYCGYSIKQPKKCPNCDSAKLTIKGYGTEKIEDDLEVLFPESRIVRMDLDTTRKRKALENIIQSFGEGSYDILVGTQMVTKGLDFDGVGLVVVMNADSLWNRPDFRAFERAFQLLVQVAGRAGRQKSRGTVLIQTYKTDHPVLDMVRQHNYKAMYESQITDRRSFEYPPFSRLVKVTLLHKDAKLVREASKYVGINLREHFNDRVLGPEEPPIARVRNRYLRQLYIKLEARLSPSKSRSMIWEAIDALEGHPEFRRVRYVIDVDPI